MKIRRLGFLVATHIAAGVLGFSIGIYALPILIAPPSPSEGDIKTISSVSDYSGEFRKDLKGSDALHWGEGRVSVSSKHVTFIGKLAPGPDYKLYLSPKFLETEAEFERSKQSMSLVGDVKTFDNFVVKVPPDIEVSQFNTIIIWCETFGEFITSAKYRN
jgi:hypothetical protein